MSMDCHWTRIHLARFLDGEMDPDEKARIEKHLADCPDCRACIAELRETDRLARDAGVTPLPEDEAAFGALLTRVRKNYDLDQAAQLRREEMAAGQEQPTMSAEEVASAPLEPALRRVPQGTAAVQETERTRRSLGRVLSGWFAPAPRWRWAGIASAAAAAAVVTIVLIARNPDLPQTAYELGVEHRGASPTPEVPTAGQNVPAREGISTGDVSERRESEKKKPAEEEEPVFAGGSGSEKTGETTVETADESAAGNVAAGQVVGGMTAPAGSAEPGAGGAAAEEQSPDRASKGTPTPQLTSEAIDKMETATAYASKSDADEPTWGNVRETFGGPPASPPPSPEPAASETPPVAEGSVNETAGASPVALESPDGSARPASPAEVALHDVSADARTDLPVAIPGTVTRAEDLSQKIVDQGKVLSRPSSGEAVRGDRPTPNRMRSGPETAIVPAAPGSDAEVRARLRAFLAEGGEEAVARELTEATGAGLRRPGADADSTASLEELLWLLHETEARIEERAALMPAGRTMAAMEALAPGWVWLALGDGWFRFWEATPAGERTEPRRMLAAAGEDRASAARKALDAYTHALSAAGRTAQLIARMKESAQAPGGEGVIPSWAAEDEQARIRARIDQLQIEDSPE